jgi:hypothetical protein
MMNFTDPLAERCYIANFIKTNGFSIEERQVSALMHVHEQSYALGGPDSPGVHESIWHLLLPRLRSELRRWYRHSGVGMQPATAALRVQLSQLAKETF